MRFCFAVCWTWNALLLLLSDSTVLCGIGKIQESLKGLEMASPNELLVVDGDDTLLSQVLLK